MFSRHERPMYIQTGESFHIYVVSGKLVLWRPYTLCFQCKVLEKDSAYETNHTICKSVIFTWSKKRDSISCKIRMKWVTLSCWLRTVRYIYTRWTKWRNILSSEDKLTSISMHTSNLRNNTKIRIEIKEYPSNWNLSLLSQRSFRSVRELKSPSVLLALLCP